MDERFHQLLEQMTDQELALMIAWLKDHQHTREQEASHPPADC